DLRYEAGAISPWLSVRHDANPASPLTVAVEPGQVRAAVAPLAAPVYRPSRDAAYAFDPASGDFAITAPGVSERRLDADATVAAVVAALEQPGDDAAGGVREVAPVTRSRAPALTAADVTAANRLAVGSYLAGPLVFRDGERQWTVPVAQLASWLTIEPG